MFLNPASETIPSRLVRLARGDVIVLAHGSQSALHRLIQADERPLGVKDMWVGATRPGHPLMPRCVRTGRVQDLPPAVRGSGPGSDGDGGPVRALRERRRGTKAVRSLALAGKVALLVLLGAAGAAHRARTLPRLKADLAVRARFLAIALGKIVLLAVAMSLALRPLAPLCRERVRWSSSHSRRHLRR